MLKLILVLILFFAPFHANNNEWLREVNQLRDEVNTQPLKIDPLLTLQCSMYAKKLARTQHFVHDPNLGRKLGENIAMSTNETDDPIEIWRNSAGHYRNKVDRDFRKVGIAKASNSSGETYWVMRLR